MRRSRLMPLSGLFFNTGDRREKTVDESFTHTRHYADTINEGMMESDRLEHKKQEEQKKQVQNQASQNPELKSNHGPGQAPAQNCL